MTYRGFVVSHTHWDRAWYLPFEAFRLRLVRLVDRVLDLLEGDPAYRAFTLDGQAVLLDDYLEIRPFHEARLRGLVAAGRLSIGPWYTLPDLFLVAGEAIVRNLQVGQRVCARFSETDAGGPDAEHGGRGGAMREGYIPDPFGHVAQMPQILRGFGIDSYLFMRGLDAATKASHGAVFDWRAPDGSAVLAVYQREGYFPAGALGHPAVYGRFDGHTPRADLARRQIAQAVALMAPLQDERALLLSNGFDHMPEQPEAPALLAAVNEAQDPAAEHRVDLVHATLPAFFDALRAEVNDRRAREGLPVFEGDLIGNADHPILASVTSTRMYLKQQNHAAQHALMQVAEPISAWLAAEGLGEPAGPFLDHAWTLLLKNHPHDDICGCSVDPVHDEDEVRFARVAQTAEALVAEHLEALVTDGFAPPSRTGRPADAAPGYDETAPHDDPHEFAPTRPPPTGTDVFVFNPHPWPQRVRAEASVYFPNPEGEHGAPVPPHPLAACDAEGRAMPVTVLRTEAPVLRSAYLEATWSRRYDIAVEVEVPALGYHLVHVYQDPDAPPDNSPPADSLPRLSGEGRGEAPAAPASALALEHDRALLTLGADGPYLHDRATGATLGPLLGFEYQLDDGDTYSFGPRPEHGPWRAAFVRGARHPDDPGAVVLAHRLRAPSSFSRADGPGPLVTTEITTTLRLAPTGLVEAEVAYENARTNGRLRAVVPTGIATDTLLVDGHFRMPERTRPTLRTPESDPERWQGYPGELDYPTHHQGAFAMVEEGTADDALRVVVANRGLPEVELLDTEDGGALAVTLHRAVGFLSVEGGRIRRCQAGPQVPTPGAQCLRSIRAHLAVGLGRMPRLEAMRRALAFAHPAAVRELPYLPYVEATGTRARSGSLLALDTPAVRLSAFKPHDTEAGVLVVRVWNATGEAQPARLTLGVPATAWCRTDLHEAWDDGAARPVEDGTVALTLGPHQIATVLLRR